VVLVSPSVSSRELIKKTLAVITVTGTAGWEAIVNDKPCVYFGYPWYSRFPQALSGSLSNLQGTLNELVGGDKRAPEFDADTVNNCFFDFAINCDLHGYNSGHADRNPEKMVDYLIQYCVPIQGVGDGHDGLGSAQLTEFID
jgi:hypothetical protein